MEMHDQMHMYTYNKIAGCYYFLSIRYNILSSIYKDSDKFFFYIGILLS